MSHAEKVRSQLRKRIKTALEYIDLVCAGVSGEGAVATGSANGPREADVHSAKSRADRRPKGIWYLVAYLRAQEFGDPGWLLRPWGFSAQFALQLSDALFRAAQLLEPSRFANYLFQLVVAHGKSSLSWLGLLAASARSRLNVASIGYWFVLPTPNSPELSRTVRVAKS